MKLYPKMSSPEYISYCKSIGNYPLLSRDAERRLTDKVYKLNQWEKERDYHVQKLCVDQISLQQWASLIGISESELIEDLSDLQNARDELIQCHLKLVVSFSKSYFRWIPSSSILDVIQDGNCALVRATQSFEPHRELRFSTYASWFIKNAVKSSAFQIHSEFAGLECNHTDGFNENTIENMSQRSELWENSEDALIWETIEFHLNDSISKQHAELVKMRFGIGSNTAKQCNYLQLAREFNTTRYHAVNTEKQVLSKLRNLCSVLKVTLTYSVFYFSCDSVTSISRFQIQQIDLQELDNLFISKHQT